MATHVVNKLDINICKITVDYDKNIDSRLKYLRCDKWITSQNFPTRRHGKHSLLIQLVRFPGRYITVPRACKRLKSMGLRPAELRELLALRRIAKYAFVIAADNPVRGYRNNDENKGRPFKHQVVPWIGSPMGGVAFKRSLMMGLIFYNPPKTEYLDADVYWFAAVRR